MLPYFYLTVALLLPWLGGYLWLAVAESWLHPGRGNTARQLGYGLFLGCAALQGVVLAYNYFFGTVAFWPILAVLCLIALAGGVLYTTRCVSFRKEDSVSALAAPVPPAPRQTGRLHTALFWLFTAWAAGHLLFVAIEILHRPVFAWDAWLNWMYRAKAWFYSGQIFVLDQPSQWLDGTGQTPYNLAANHYPTLVPVLGMWAATALGHWSETLVNLPALGCGIALGLALYGQCRAYGLAPWSSVLCTYLLLSIPLIGAHLALAGGADIWMAGFTGLGFVALLHGIVREDRSQVLLGLGMAALAMGVKLEGGVWFAAALLTLGLAAYTRFSLIALAALASLAALGWALGVTYLELPLLGGLGIADGRVHIPLLGNYALQSFALWDDYRDNFFLSGTWHLLWVFLLLAVAALAYLPAGRLRRTLAVFYLVMLLTQLFIFQGTESGQWAEDWTAINRLPLHFAPALVFSLVILWRALADKSAAAARSLPMVARAALGLAVTLAGATVFLLATYPARDGQAQHYTTANTQLVVGGGRSEDNIVVIDRYQNEVAILSSGPVSFEAKPLGLARIETASGTQKRATFFWRNGKTDQDLHSVDVSGQGSRWISLSDLPTWQGHVTEIGLIFYADGDKVVRFYSLDLMPNSLSAQIEKLAHDWMQTSTWSQKSVNWLPAGAESTALPLPALMAMWVLLMALVAVLMASRHRPGAANTLLLAAITAWSILDLRWTVNGLAQAQTTLGTFPLVRATDLGFGDDDRVRQLVETARPILDEAGKRTVVMAEDPAMVFQMLRAKYHALPVPVYVHKGGVDTLPAQLADFVLVIRGRHPLPNYVPTPANDYIRTIERRDGIHASAVWERDEGFLLALSHKPSVGTQNR